MTVSKYAGFFRQIIAGSAASLGVLACAIVYAWVTPILTLLLSPESEIPMTSEEASWMISMPEYGNLISPLPAGFMADRFGRKIVILICAPIFLVGWIIILYFKTLWALNIARIIQGLAVGMVYTVVPLYLGEIASPQYRGAVTSIFYCLWWFGFLLEYVLGPLMSFMNYTYVSASTNIIFFLAFLWQPETPYYYLMKNDTKNAYKSLSWLLKKSEEETMKELESMKYNVEEDQMKKTTWKELVATATDRKALMILFTVGFLRQYCGLIPLSLYSTETLSSTGDDFIISPNNVTIAMGVMMLIGSFGGFFTLDLFGRKFLLFLSCTLSGVSMFCAGTFYFFLFQTEVNVSKFGWVPPIALMVLSGISVVGIFPVNVAYASELFTSNTRGTASSVFSVYTTVLGILVLKFYLTISDNIGVYVNFYIFAVVCFIGSLLSVFVMPETKGKTFDQARLELQKKKSTV